jgi:aryl-alcohol dehydrogenase-like predicted oxidoreductase
MNEHKNIYNNRALGQTAVSVSPIGLGCWQFAGGASTAFWALPPQEVINQIVKISLDGGINWFDTAEMYGSGASEKALAGALVAAGKSDGEVVIATKWKPFGRFASSIVKTFPDREKYLSPFHVDLHQVHMPNSLSSVEKQMEAMADLLDAGKIRAAGVSNFSADGMRRAHEALKRRGYALASNQVKYNPVDRRIEQNGVMKAAKELGVTIIAYSPLAQGLLTGIYHRDTAAIDRLPMIRRRMVNSLLEKTRPLARARGR